MNSTSSAPDANVLANISSLYGPGTVIGWYLTASSVLLTWASQPFHPYKRRSDSINVDLIATLTLLVVAACQLIYQACATLRNNMLYEDQKAFAVSAKVAELIANVEAPLVITETFVWISALLFMLAINDDNFRRTYVVGFVWLLCFVIDCFIKISNFFTLDRFHQARPLWPRHSIPSRSRVVGASLWVPNLFVLVALLLCLTANVILAASHGYESNEQDRASQYDLSLHRNTD